MFKRIHDYAMLLFQIGDFGMARDLMDDTYYKSSGGKIPVKWTAPEVRKITAKIITLCLPKSREFLPYTLWWQFVLTSYYAWSSLYYVEPSK